MNSFIAESFCCEFGTFLGILENSRDLDGASPINIVEALTEDYFLKDAFFHFGIS